MDITAQLVAAQLLGSMWIGGRESRTTIDIVMSAHTAPAWCGPILLVAGPGFSRVLMCSQICRLVAGIRVESQAPLANHETALAIIATECSRMITRDCAEFALLTQNRLALGINTLWLGIHRWQPSAIGHTSLICI